MFGLFAAVFFWNRSKHPPHALVLGVSLNLGCWSFCSPSRLHRIIRRLRGKNLFHGPDPSIHMLGLPKSYPQLGRWVALAILTGAIAAFLLVVLADH